MNDNYQRSGLPSLIVSQMRPTGSLQTNCFIIIIFLLVLFLIIKLIDSIANGDKEHEEWESVCERERVKNKRHRIKQERERLRENMELG